MRKNSKKQKRVAVPRSLKHLSLFQELVLVAACRKLLDKETSRPIHTPYKSRTPEQMKAEGFMFTMLSDDRY